MTEWMSNWKKTSFKKEIENLDLFKVLDEIITNREGQVVWVRKTNTIHCIFSINAGCRRTFPHTQVFMAMKRPMSLLKKELAIYNRCRLV